MTPKGRQDGWLVLADISGYTAFLTGTELEHAHAILQDLMRGLLGSLGAPLRLVKLEGDAVFSYALSSDVPDGRAIVDRLEDAYHAFRMQLFNVARSSTCTCSACKSAPSLDLKFMLHFGEFVIHDLAGHDDLQGTDVIVVHRLLKNDVAEKTGKRAYLLTTAAARTRIAGIAWADHSEVYEHLGEIKCGWRDLHAAFAELTASGSNDVQEADAHMLLSYDVAAPLALTWDWHMDSDKVVQWQGLSGWQIAPNDAGRVRPGSMVHCAHGETRKDMQVLGWRPYDTATFDGPEVGWKMPAMVFTYKFEPIDAQNTRVTWRLKLSQSSLRYRITGFFMGRAFPSMGAKWALTLNRLLKGAAA